MLETSDWRLGFNIFVSDQLGEWKFLLENRIENIYKSLAHSGFVGVTLVRHAICLENPLEFCFLNQDVLAYRICYLPGLLTSNLYVIRRQFNRVEVPKEIYGSLWLDYPDISLWYFQPTELERWALTGSDWGRSGFQRWRLEIGCCRRRIPWVQAAIQ